WRRLRLDALVMVMHRHSQGFLRVLLPDAIGIQLPFDFGGPGHGELRLLLLLLKLQLAVEDVFAQDDAIVADVNARPGDELAHFRVRLAAETAHRDVGRTGHVQTSMEEYKSITGHAKDFTPAPAFFHRGNFLQR